MDRFEEGYIEGKRNAKYFSTVNEIKERYSNLNDTFIAGFLKAYKQYWEDQLMGEF
jgi:hypothetical protein